MIYLEKIVKAWKDYKEERTDAAGFVEIEGSGMFLCSGEALTKDQQSWDEEDSFKNEDFEKKACYLTTDTGDKPVRIDSLEDLLKLEEANIDSLIPEIVEEILEFQNFIHVDVFFNSETEALTYEPNPSNTWVQMDEPWQKIGAFDGLYNSLLAEAYGKVYDSLPDDLDSGFLDTKEGKALIDKAFEELKEETRIALIEEIIERVKQYA